MLKLILFAELIIIIMNCEIIIEIHDPDFKILAGTV
jgi:hypothetical protein